MNKFFFTGFNEGDSGSWFFPVVKREFLSDDFEVLVEGRSGDGETRDDNGVVGLLFREADNGLYGLLGTRSFSRGGPGD